MWCTVYPKKYAHAFNFAVLCCGYTLADFPISIRLTSLALWQSNDCSNASKATLMNMDKYFMWIHYERLHNHNKAKHNKTVCIFLEIYCIYNHTDIARFCKMRNPHFMLMNWNGMKLDLFNGDTPNAIQFHYDDVIMSTMASQITDLTIVYSTVYSSADRRKHQSSASLAFVQGIHQRPVNSPHKWPVTREVFPFDDVIMSLTHMCITRQWPVAWPAPSH